jgi:hypothetical protein
MNAAVRAGNGYSVRRYEGSLRVDLSRLPWFVLEAEDASGLTFALLGQDSQASHADAACMMKLRNDALHASNC